MTDVVAARASSPVLRRAHVRRAVAAVTAASAVLATAGCQSTTLPRGNAAVQAPAASTSTVVVPPADASTSTASSPSAVIPSSPAYPKPQVLAAGLVRGAQRWDRPITLHVHHGRLLSARVVDATTGQPLQGALSANGWVATGTEVPSRTYRVRADVRGLDARTAHTILTLRTSQPTATVDTDVSPYGGATVGVGAAIIVTFSRPVTDQVAASRALRVTTSTPVTGAWRWFSPTEVHWRPKVYWPAHTRVTLHEDLLGVQLAPGVWGLRNRDVQFAIGDTHITTVDVATQTMTVRNNGAVLGTYPVSTGRAAYPTKGGVHVVLNKVPSIIMDSRTVGIPKSSRDFYYETVLWDVRISDGGAFVHYAPWSIRFQGHQPVSHGCINVNLSAATMFYNLSVPGDVVDIVNDPTPPNRNDPGMADWNYLWAQWQGRVPS